MYVRNIDSYPMERRHSHDSRPPLMDYVQLCDMFEFCCCAAIQHNMKLMRRYHNTLAPFLLFSLLFCEKTSFPYLIIHTQFPLFEFLLQSMKLSPLCLTKGIHVQSFSLNNIPYSCLVRIERALKSCPKYPITHATVTG